jgi:hypothetical protein
MSDPTDYTNLLSKRRVRDIHAGSLIPVKLNRRDTLESIFPFYDSMPSPTEFQAMLDRTTATVLPDDYIVIPMEVEGTEENIAIE